MSARTVAEAIDACRRGWPIAVRGEGGALQLLAVETADADRLAAFAPDGFDLLISAERAATLALGNQMAGAAGGAVRIARSATLDLDGAVAVVDPSRDLSDPMKGPFVTVPLDVGTATAGDAAIKLARLAGLLPAFFMRTSGGPIAPAPYVDAIVAYDQPSALRIASRAQLPVAASHRCEIVAFRSAEEAVEHVALVIGAPNGRSPLVRLHSECLTGDVFGSLKCDCGPQLDGAIARIAEEGWGILVYLRQEGRGIGLINKLRAYALQDQGFDTVDANLRLGFAVDARDFGTAARMLRLLGQERVRLLTNNPAKVSGLVEAGIAVEERLAHATSANPFNSHYLDVKRSRTGHLL